MAFVSVIDDLMVCAVWLLVGYAVRQVVSALRKCFIPASVVGGVLALSFGPQALGIIEVPVTFSEYASGLVNLVFTSFVWGIAINWDKLKEHLDYCTIQWAVGYWQVFVCAGLGIILTGIWVDLPVGWGLMAPFGFFAGHGTAVAMGTLYEDYGIYGNVDIGIIFSTLGIIFAMLVGTVIVNVGIRKGWAEFVKPDGRQAGAERGAVAKTERVAIGMTRISNSAMNNFLFQFALLLFVLWFGTQVFALLGNFIPWVAQIPSTLHGIVGCLILWPLARKFRLDDYVDGPTVKTISGALVDVLVLGAIATLNLDLVSKFWLPLLIMSVVCVIVTVAFTFFMCRRCCETEWFEKFIFTYGVASGLVSTGFALHRMLDPDGVSVVPEAQGITSGVQAPFNFPMYAFLVAMSVGYSGCELVVGLAVAVVFTVIPWVLYRKRIRNSCGR